MSLPPTTGDYHGWTAAHDEEFHRHMRATFGEGWADRMEGKTIRQFAKSWNFAKLYGNKAVTPISPTVQGANARLELHFHGINEVVKVGGVLLAQAKAFEATGERRGPSGPLPSSFSMSGTVDTDEDVAPAPAEVKRAVDVLSATTGAPGTGNPPPESVGTDRPTKTPHVWPKVTVDVRRWDHGGMTTQLMTHGQVAMVTLPIEVLRVLTDVYWREYEELVLQFRDMPPGVDVADAIAKSSNVRPDAATQAYALAMHLRNTLV